MFMFMLLPHNLVLLCLLLPIAAVVGIGLAGKSPNRREAVTLAVSLALLVAVLKLLLAVLAGARPEVILGHMLPQLAIKFSVEPLGMIFATLAAILWPLNSLYSIGYMRGNNETNQTRFYSFFAVAIAATMGIAFAGNLVTLFIFYEILTISTLPLVAHQGNATALHGGRIYLGILLATSICLLLPAIIWTWMLAGTTDFIAGGILQGKISGPLLTCLIALFLFGIGKAAVMPVHRWLPAAMVAPTPVSALLHAVAVVKAGVFSIIKIFVYIVGLDLANNAPGVAGLLGIVCFSVLAASVIALAQDNLKKRLAYSTIGQLGYVVLGAILLAPISIVGAALQLIVHAFGKITLFFAAGAIYTSCKKTEISQLNGIGHRMPFTMAAFTIGALSMIGVPPAAGFIAKWYLLMGAFEAEQLLAVAVIIISTLLNAAYFVPIIYAAYFKRDTSDTLLTYGEAPLPVVIAVCTTAALTIALFIFPTIPLTLARLIPT